MFPIPVARKSAQAGSISRNPAAARLGDERQWFLPDWEFASGQRVPAKAGGRPYGLRHPVPCTPIHRSAAATPRSCGNLTAATNLRREHRHWRSTASDDAPRASNGAGFQPIGPVPQSRDGLPGASHCTAAQRGSCPCLCTLGRRCIRRVLRATPEPGVRAQLEGPLPTGEPPRRQERVPPWPATDDSAQSGSGVPRPL